jgi:hypothetical protein
VVTALILSVHPDYSIVEKRNPNFQYGEVQAAVAVFILVICIIGKSEKECRNVFLF